MNAFPMIERSAVRQWEALSETEREMEKLYNSAGRSSLSHPPLVWLWWVEAGPRSDRGYTLLPLMTVKQG